ncbi:MAG: Gfo/Idh/MocA family oxidoreductase [Kiritimatiellia bacterium]|nr:Gfo/Idh/MocA family oxidoreductase [Kiritimatiellia bacterium]
MKTHSYLPEIKPARVVKDGEFIFAASHFDHSHIYGQTRGLVAAGGVCKYIFEPRDELIKPLGGLLDQGTRRVSAFEEILEDPEIHLVTSAAIPNRRCALGLNVLDAGKDYFTDKSPFTTLEQLEQARSRVRATGRKYSVCYSERLNSESGWWAGELIRQGALGRVLQVLNTAPHNLGATGRPDWFFRKEGYGGILTDIGSHQFEQFLAFSGALDGRVEFARVENFCHPEHPELEDFGEAALALDNGCSAYCRLDWLNPAGLRTWGDGRTFVLGTRGTLEVRKNINVAREDGGNRIFLVDGAGEHEIDCAGKVGHPFFGQLILDVLNRTENAMTQAHAFKAAELSMQAQRVADARRAKAGFGNA